MNEKSWDRNTSGIAAHAQKRKEQKHQSVEEAIAALLREQQPVNFHTVAKRAAVSKAYLYSQPDLRERIDVFSPTNKKTPSKNCQSKTVTSLAKIGLL